MIIIILKQLLIDILIMHHFLNLRPKPDKNKLNVTATYLESQRKYFRIFATAHFENKINETSMLLDIEARLCFSINMHQFE